MPNRELPNPNPNVVIEVAPAVRGYPPDALDFIKALVERHFAELVSRRTDFAFRPFLETSRVSREIKQLQTVPERLAWGRVFQEHGCLHCRRHNLVHAGCGLCGDCYGKILAWKKKAIRENGTAGESEIDFSFKLAACDQERLARLALSGAVEESETISPVETAMEPQRHAAWCMICSHPRRAEIEQDYIKAGRTYGAIRAIVREYGLKGTAGLYKHARALGLNAKRAEYAQV